MTAATATMVERARWIVEVFAKSYARRWPSLPSDELTQVGLVALFDQARRFDPTRGVAFETFAYQRVQFAMLDYARKERKIGGRELVGARLAARDEEVAEVSLTETRPAREAILAGLRARVACSVTCDAVSTDDSSDDKLDRAQRRHAVRTALATLPDDEREFFHRFYEQELTLEEIGVAMGRSKKTAQRIHERIKEKLAQTLFEQA